MMPFHISFSLLLRNFFVCAALITTLGSQAYSQPCDSLQVILVPDTAGCCWLIDLNVQIPFPPVYGVKVSAGLPATFSSAFAFPPPTWLQTPTTFPSSDVTWTKIGGGAIPVGFSTLGRFCLDPVNAVPKTLYIEWLDNLQNVICSDSLSIVCGDTIPPPPPLPDTTSIRGMKFNDLDCDGVKDPGEPGLAGWTITISGPAGYSTTTDINGNYVFTGIPSGSYLVSEILKPGWQQTKPNNLYPPVSSYYVYVNFSNPGVGLDFGNCCLTGTDIIQPLYVQACSAGIVQVLPSGIVDPPPATGQPAQFQFSMCETTDVIIDFMLPSFLDCGNDVQIPVTFNATSAGWSYIGGTNPPDLTPFHPSVPAIIPVLPSQPVFIYLGAILSIPDSLDCRSCNGSFIMNINGDNGTSYALPNSFTLASCDSICCGGELSGLKYNDLNGNGSKEGGEGTLPDFTINLTGPTGASYPPLGTMVANPLVPFTTSSGVGIAFDGQYVYYTHRSNATLNVMTPSGVPVASYPLPRGVGAITYDKDRNWIWCGSYDASGHIFATDLFGNLVDPGFFSGSVPGTGGVGFNFDGLQYDPRDQTLWWGNDLKPEVFHTTLTGTFLSTFVAPGGGNRTGIAFDGNNLWLAVHNSSLGNKVIVKVTDNGAVLCQFTGQPSPFFTEDLEFDCVTFAPDIVLWAHSAYGSPNRVWAYSISLCNNATINTSAGGDYSFVNLPPGNYTISEVPKPGWTQTEPVSPTTYTVAVSAGQSTTGLDFGNKSDSISTLCGKKWDDLNCDGDQDIGEPGLAGVTIQLSGPVNTSIMTDLSGNYCFTNLPAGTYTISEIVPPGRTQTFPTSPGTHIVNLIPGASINNLNFGNCIPDSTSCVEICGMKFYDADCDGVKDSNEVGLPNWLIRLTGTVEDSVYTDSLGNYCFDDLPLGNYVVSEEKPKDWKLTYPPDGFYLFKALNCTTYTNVDFGNSHPGTICGTKWNDRNRNGRMDPGERGLAGWKIYLRKLCNISPPVYCVVDSAITDSLGNYCFYNVCPGEYRICEQVKPGWRQTFPRIPRCHRVTLTPGGRLFNLDFGNARWRFLISSFVCPDCAYGPFETVDTLAVIRWPVSIARLNPYAPVFEGFWEDGEDLPEIPDGMYSIKRKPVGNYSLVGVRVDGIPVFDPDADSVIVILGDSLATAEVDFINVFSADSTLTYRTFTAAQLSADNQKKVVKRARPGKPINIPSTANVLSQLFLSGGQLRVGLPNMLTSAGKEKGYLLPGKQTNTFATFNTKSLHHVSTPRGLDFYNSGVKLILKKQKTLPPTKHNNKLLANMLALKINIVASDLGITPEGFAGLVFDPVEADSALEQYRGMTVADIALNGDSLMMLWEGTPFSKYLLLDSVVTLLNASFSEPLPFDSLEVLSWLSGLPLDLPGVRPLLDVPYLKMIGEGSRQVHYDISGELFTAESFELSQNYPNPFNPVTTIQFELPDEAFVTLRVFNILGQEVVTLFDNEILDAGSQEVLFDARRLASGVYFYRMEASSVENPLSTFTKIKKMVLLK